MAGAVVTDVGDGFVEAADGFDGQGQVEIFRAVVFFRGGLDHVREKSGQERIAIHFDAGGLQDGDDLWVEAFRHAFVDQQRFGGVAGTGLFGFGIEKNLFGHRQISRGININVADAVVMFDHRHPREAHHGFDEAFATERDDEVEILVHLREVLHTLAVGEGHQLDGGIAMEGLAATPQDGGVAALEAKDGRVAGDVGATFVDDADDADGDADFPDLQTIGACPRGEFLTNRIGQVHHLPDALRHGGDTGGIQHQAVEHGRAETLGPAGFEYLQFVMISN